MDTNKTPIYPFEPWNVTEDHLDLAMNYRNETTFALSNGYIGTRGTHEEAYDFDEQHGLEEISSMVCTSRSTSATASGTSASRPRARQS